MSIFRELMTAEIEAKKKSMNRLLAIDGLLIDDETGQIVPLMSDDEGVSE